MSRIAFQTTNKQNKKTVLYFWNWFFSRKYACYGHFKKGLKPFSREVNHFYFIHKTTKAKRGLTSQNWFKIIPDLCKPGEGIVLFKMSGKHFLYEEFKLVGCIKYSFCLAESLFFQGTLNRIFSFSFKGLCSNLHLNDEKVSGIQL